MPHDEELAERLRDLLAGDPAIAEKRMFGGIAFMAGGHLAVCASGQGGLMARVDPSDTASLVERPGVRRMEMKGRELDGWLRVDTDRVADDGALREWTDRSLDFVRTLPPKR